MEIDQNNIKEIRRITTEIVQVELETEIITNSRNVIPALTINNKDYVLMTGEICVQTNDKSDIYSIAKKYTLKVKREYANGVFVLESSNPNETLKIANIIHENEMVKFACPNFVQKFSSSYDPYYSSQYYLKNTGQFGGTAGLDINAEGAWNISKGCNNVRVAVLDNGLENHDDFSGRVVAGFTPGAVNNFGAPFGSGSGHGTACAGIIAASHDNSEGIRGVAPNVTLVPVNVLNNSVGGSFTSSEIASAIDWAVSPTGGNADILSNSYNATVTGFPDPVIQTAFTNAMNNGRGGKGAIVVFSSGNHNSIFSGVAFPANISGVITVGAITKNGAICNFSSRGAEMDLVAFGGNDSSGDIVTTDRMDGNGYVAGDYLTDFGGTSAAAPQVSGVAALMLSVNPNLTRAQVTTMLQQTATDMGASGFDNTFGYGRVNAHKALERALGGPVVGPELFCSTGTYTLTGTPAGTVSWTATGVGINSSTGVASWAYDGLAHIRPQITTPCGAVNLVKPVSAGVPNPSYIFAEAWWIGSGLGYKLSPSGNTQVEAGYDAPGASLMLEYQWNITDHTNWYVTPLTTTSVELNYWALPNPTSQKVYIRGRNSCGWGLYQETTWLVGPYVSRYTVSPNPTTDKVTLLFEDLKSAQGIPEYAELMNESSTIPVRSIKVTEKDYEAIKNDGSRLSLDVRDLPRGIYYLHVSFGGKQKPNTHRVILK